MYTPAYSRMEDLDQIHAFVREYGFATLVTGGPKGLQATHVPLLLDSGGEVLRGHMARANPQWKAFGDGEVLAVFHGPHAYVSPAWYASPKAVPTWNYAAVHAYGTMRLIEEDVELLALLAESVAFYEGGRGAPWPMQAAEELMPGLLGGIVGFEMTVTRWEGKEKLSQNRSDADRQGVVSGLVREGGSEGAKVARRMRNAFAETKR